MRVKGTYVLTGGLEAVALSAPFTLPRVLDSQGSGAFGLRAAAPPAAPTTVVRMAALPRPKRAVPSRPTLVRATQRAAVAHSSGSSLASVHTRTAPVTTATHWIPRHRPVPVEQRRAPDPAPAPPTASVTPLTPEPVNLNASVPAATASSPAPAVTPAAPVTVAAHSVPAPDEGNSEHGQSHGEGNGHGHGHDH